jgi:hypothetical protein
MDTFIVETTNHKCDKLKFKLVIITAHTLCTFNQAPYLRYIKHLFSIRPIECEAEAEIPYRDLLQSPLQPLMDNLESQIYETFEKDPIKYVQYEQVSLSLFNYLLIVKKDKNQSINK